MAVESDVSLGEIALIFAGMSASRLKAMVGVAQTRIVNVRDVSTSLAPLTALDLMELVPDKQLNSIRLEQDDVVVTARGSLRAAVVEMQHIGAVAGANLVVVRPKQGLRPHVLAAFLRHPRVEKKLLADFSGSVTSGFTLNSIRNLRMNQVSSEKMVLANELVILTEKYYTDMLNAATTRRMIALEIVQRELFSNKGDEVAG